MDVPTTITLHFPGGSAEVLHSLSLAGAAALLLARDYPLRKRPLLLELQEPAKKLYYQEGILQWYLTGQSTYAEVLQALWCDGLYCNNTNLATQYDYQIEAGSLWMLRGPDLILVSDDEPVSCLLADSADLFDKIA